MQTLLAPHFFSSSLAANRSSRQSQPGNPSSTHPSSQQSSLHPFDGSSIGTATTSPGPKNSQRTPIYTHSLPSSPSCTGSKSCETGNSRCMTTMCRGLLSRGIDRPMVSLHTLPLASRQGTSSLLSCCFTEIATLWLISNRCCMSCLHIQLPFGYMGTNIWMFCGEATSMKISSRM